MEAAKAGKVELVKWLYEVLQEDCDHPFLRKACDRACEHGHLSVIQFFEEKLGIVPVNISKAVIAGHSQVVEYLVTKYKNNVKFSKYSVQEASISDNPCLARFLDPDRKLSYSKQALEMAVTGEPYWDSDKSMEMITFLFSKPVRPGLCHQMLSNAIERQTFRCHRVCAVQATCDANSNPDSDGKVDDGTDEDAEANVGTESNGESSADANDDANVDENTDTDAAADANTTDNDPDLEYVAFKAVQKPNNARFLRFLYRIQPQAFRRATVDLSACSGCQSNVRFLHQELNRVGTTRAIDSASAGGFLHVIKYVATHIPDATCTTKAMDGAACNGPLHVVQYLHNRFPNVGCTKFAMMTAASNGHLEIVRFLHEHRHEGCTTSAMDNAAVNGDLAVVRFLHENRSEGCTSEAIRQAASKGNREMVAFLLANRQEATVQHAMESACDASQAELVLWLVQTQADYLTSADYRRAQEFAQTTREQDEGTSKAAPSRTKQEILAFVQMHLFPWSKRRRCH